MNLTKFVCKANLARFCAFMSANRSAVDSSRCRVSWHGDVDFLDTDCADEDIECDVVCLEGGAEYRFDWSYCSITHRKPRLQRDEL
jgi:hypothetical protein